MSAVKSLAAPFPRCFAPHSLPVLLPASLLLILPNQNVVSNISTKTPPPRTIVALMSHSLLGGAVPCGIIL